MQQCWFWINANRQEVLNRKYVMTDICDWECRRGLSWVACSLLERALLAGSLQTPASAQKWAVLNNHSSCQKNTSWRPFADLGSWNSPVLTLKRGLGGSDTVTQLAGWGLTLLGCSVLTCRLHWRVKVLESPAAPAQVFKIRPHVQSPRIKTRLRQGLNI